ncbi:MAG: AAA family ATPase [Nitrososphaeraceae archaeon]|nr:AAA family ATPase [Nitrososphaeraceae archaeon]
MAVPDAGTIQEILQKVRSIIPTLNDNSALGIKNAQILRCLLILYVANMDPKYGYLGEIDGIDNLRYFTIGELNKVSKKKGTAYPIDFTGPRATTPYEACQKDGYVKIRKGLGNRTSFALIEKGKRHCRDLVEHMYSEKYQQGDPMLISTRNRATDQMTALNDLLSVDQFIERREIQTILNKYPIFIGREIEIEKLDSFLEDPTKSVMLVTGEGGTGKTRLVLEFVKRLQDSRDYESKYHIYFIDPYKETYPHSLPANSLIILDDAERKSTHLNHIIGLVSYYDKSNRSKLLLIERSIFKAYIENEIKEKNTGSDTLYLERGDIIKFLKQNFCSIDEYTCDKIEHECRSSFDYAAAFAEYYINGGKLLDLRDVLSWKTERYIKDIAVRTKSDVADVKYVIELLAMIVPVTWDIDKYYFKREFPNVFDTMEKILFGARNMYEDSVILTENNSTFLIKPEPLGDFFRLNALENSRLQNALWNLIPYIPMRIAYNIRITTDADDLSTLRNELLFKVWSLLNEKKGCSPEFIKAIAYFTGNISYHVGPVLLNSRKPNIENWLECFYEFYDTSHSEQLSGYLTIALLNLGFHYRKVKNFELLDSSLQYFDILYKKYRSHYYEICGGYIMGGVRHPNPKVMEKYLDKLKLLYTKYPSELDFSYGNLLNLTHKCHADNDSTPRPKLLYGYIKKLRYLYERHKSEKIAEILITALVNSIRIFSEYKMFDYVINDIRDRRDLYAKHQNAATEVYIGIALASANHAFKGKLLNQEFKHC